MNTPPEDDDEREELAELHAEPWMVAQLDLNPSYPHWAPGDDCMGKRAGGWESPAYHATWSDFGMKELDDWNEVVHWYFDVSRDAKRCEACRGQGLNPATLRLSDDWYDFEGTGRRWKFDLTEDEVQALHAEHRLFDYPADGPCPSAAEINEIARGTVLFHDAINQMICVRTRAKRLGIYGHCEHCLGKGYVYTSEKATLRLVLWVLHPRHGASRGMEIRAIERTELPEVYRFLSQAASRNAERFRKVVELAATLPVEGRS